MILTTLLRTWLTRSFRPFIFRGRSAPQGGKQSLKLNYAAAENLGLYVHIPFCRTICGFCPYNKEIYSTQAAAAYKAALLAEIGLVGGVPSANGKKSVTSLYFGGGTPALMARDLSDIIQKLREYFVITGDIGIELHPDDVDTATLQTIKDAGVTMVSIGVQSFDADCLSMIGRTYNDFENKIALAKSFGFSVIDVDLIFAIPGQSEQTLKNDLAKALQSGATQISTYPFIDFTFADNAYKPLPSARKKRLLKSILAQSGSLGLTRTSVWTFALKGTQKYSSVTRDNFLGFGPGATTLLKDIFKVNTFSVSAYIQTVSEGTLPTALTLSFTPRQRAAYFLFWSAYGLKIREEDFKKATGRSLSDMFGLELALGGLLGLFKKTEEGYSLTQKASFLYHKIEQVYTTAYIDKMWNIARKVPFPQKIVLK
jgi:oxygen-independent coproporphyrinogen-3 oxidase